MTDQAEEPRDRTPDDEATALLGLPEPPRGGLPLRTILLAAGIAVVVVAAVIGVTLGASGSSPAASSKVVAGASGVPLPSDSSTDESDTITVGTDPGCAPAESAITTLLDNLISDVTNPTQALADVQAAAATVKQASAASKSAAVKQSLGKTSTDLAALNAVASTGDASKISSALSPLSGDVASLYTACGA